MLRFFDVIFSASGIIFLAPLYIVLFIVLRFESKSPLFIQRRVGRYQRSFNLVKFRTMLVGTKSDATHLTNSSFVTPIGSLLRRSKLDELPQLWNVLLGEMSLVGPRPCLLNQRDLIEERLKRGVFNIRPGITGLAQISNIDMSQPALLAEVDAKMLHQIGLFEYFQIILKTLLGFGFGDNAKDK
jgi:lipopolysaccharide/colanic/teichoic acid biosynthesis glycosyltransferase